jgi:hypothetical protein
MKNVRKNIYRFRDKITSFQNILINIKDLTDTSDLIKLLILNLLNQPNGLIQQCRTEFEGLVTKLNPKFKKII